MVLLAGLTVLLLVIATGFTLYAGEISGYVGNIVFDILFTTVVLFAWNFFDKKIQAEMKRKKAATAFKAFIEELSDLRMELVRFMNTPYDSLNLLVQFFNSVSVWHDKDLTDLMTSIREANVNGKYDDVFNHLTALQLHFRNAGRNEYGWNRTKKGEMVTPDKVFLGNIFGLFTHPIPFWETGRNEPKDQWNGTMWQDHCNGMNSYDVVCRQARRFMDSHTQPMIKIIDSLREVEI